MLKAFESRSSAPNRDVSKFLLHATLALWAASLSAEPVYAYGVDVHPDPSINTVPHPAPQTVDDSQSLIGPPVPPELASGSGASEASVASGAATTATSQDKKCRGAFEDTKAICIDTLGLSSIAGSLGAGAVNSSPSNNIKEQCEKASMLGKFAALLNAGKGAACEAAILRCRSQCPMKAEEGQPENTNASDDTDYLNRRCKSYQVLVLQMTAQAVAAGASSFLSNQCKKLTTVTPIVPPPLGAPPPLAPLPTYAATDCTNPANQNTPICQSQVCLNNPAAPGCAAATVDPNGLFTGDPGAGGVPFQSSINENPPIDPNVKSVNPTGAKGAEIPNTGSGGPLGGGGAGGQRTADDGPRGGGSPGFNTNVVGGAGQPGGFGGFSAPAARNAAGGGGSFMDRLKEKLGLKGLLPDKSQYSRGPASANGEITGANGLTIWQKASRQYAKDPYLKP